MGEHTPADVIRLRLRVQEEQGVGITLAQKHCAKLLHTSLRSWQQWERGERAMHKAFYELAKIKV